MAEGYKKTLIRETRAVLISVVLVPAILAWFQVRPPVIIAVGLSLLIILSIWENWSFIRARFKLSVAIGILCLVAMFAGGGWYVWNIPAPPPPPPPPPPTQVISRASKLIFACDIPPPNLTPAEAVAKREEIQKAFKTWGEVLGFTISMSDIEGGYRITIKADTLEGKNRFITAGVWPSVTTAIMDLRRIGPQIIISIYSDLPKGLEIFWMFPPNPKDPQIIEGEKEFSKLFHAREGTCHLI